MKQLTLNDAKVALSALIDDAIAGEPTVIIRGGAQGSRACLLHRMGANCDSTRLRRVAAGVSRCPGGYSRPHPQTRVHASRH